MLASNAQAATSAVSDRWWFQLALAFVSGLTTLGGVYLGARLVLAQQEGTRSRNRAAEAAERITSALVESCAAMFEMECAARSRQQVSPKDRSELVQRAWRPLRDIRGDTMYLRDRVLRERLDALPSHLAALIGLFHTNDEDGATNSLASHQDTVERMSQHFRSVSDCVIAIVRSEPYNVPGIYRFRTSLSAE